MKQVSTIHTRPPTAQKRAAARARALEQCRKGHHTSTPTFRPSETVCTTCGMVVYCPHCLNDNHLHVPLVHCYPMLCPTHTKAEVQA